jgi:outer membrane protein assembly factor BamB
LIGSDGTVYHASEDGRLRAFHTNASGEFETAPGWPATGVGLGNVVEFSSPVIGAGPNGDIIYVGTEGGLVWSINGTNTPNPSSAKVIQELEAPIRGSLTLGNDGTLYASTLDGRVFGVLTESSGLAPNAQWARAQGNNNGTGTFKIGSLGGTDGCNR